MNDFVAVNLSIAFVTFLYIVMWAHNQFYSIFEQFHHFVHCQLSYEEAANASFEYETDKNRGGTNFRSFWDTKIVEPIPLFLMF